MKTPLGNVVFILTLSKYWASVASLMYNIEVVSNIPGRPPIPLKDARPKCAYGEQYYSVVTTAQRYMFLDPPYFGGQLYTYILKIGEGNGENVVTYEGNKDKVLEVYRQIPYDPYRDCTYFRVKDLKYEDWSNAKVITTEPPNQNSPPCRYGCSSGIKVVPLSSRIVPQASTAASSRSQTSSESCPICLEMLGNGAEVINLACNHKYCKECIKNWISKNASCPLCRATVNQAKIREIGGTIRREDTNSINPHYLQQYYFQ